MRQTPWLIPDNELNAIKAVARDLDCSQRQVADAFGLSPIYIEQELERLGYLVPEGASILDVLKAHFPSAARAVQSIYPENGKPIAPLYEKPAK